MKSQYSKTIFFTTVKFSVSQFLGFYVSKMHGFAKLMNEVLWFFSQYGMLCGYESQLLGASDDVCLPNIASFHFSVSVGLALSSICTDIVKRERKKIFQFSIDYSFVSAKRAISRKKTVLRLLVWKISEFY